MSSRWVFVRRWTSGAEEGRCDAVYFPRVEEEKREEERSTTRPGCEESGPIPRSVVSVLLRCLFRALIHYRHHRGSIWRPRHHSYSR